MSLSPDEVNDILHQANLALSLIRDGFDGEDESIQDALRMAQSAINKLVNSDLSRSKELPAQAGNEDLRQLAVSMRSLEGLMRDIDARVKKVEKGIKPKIKAKRKKARPEYLAPVLEDDKHVSLGRH